MICQLSLSNDLIGHVSKETTWFHAMCCHEPRTNRYLLKFPWGGSIGHIICAASQMKHMKSDSRGVAYHAFHGGCSYLSHSLQLPPKNPRPQRCPPPPAPDTIHSHKRTVLHPWGDKKSFRLGLTAIDLGKKDFAFSAFPRKAGKFWPRVNLHISNDRCSCHGSVILSHLESRPPVNLPLLWILMSRSPQ